MRRRKKLNAAEKIALAQAINVIGQSTVNPGISFHEGKRRVTVRGYFWWDEIVAMRKYASSLGARVRIVTPPIDPFWKAVIARMEARDQGLLTDV